MGADMPPRTAFATLLVAFAIASVCAGLTTARQLHEQASNARIISRGQARPAINDRNVLLTKSRGCEIDPDFAAPGFRLFVARYPLSQPALFKG